MLDARRLGLGDDAGEVGGAAVERQLRQRDIRALEALFKTGDGILAEIVVLVDRRNLGLLQLLEDVVGEHHHLHPHFRQRREDVALDRRGQRMREGVGKQQRRLALRDERQQRGRRRGAGDGEQRHHLVLLDELLRGRDGAHRLITIILGDKLELASVHPASFVDLGECHLDAVAHALSEQRQPAGERTAHADLHGLLRSRR